MLKVIIADDERRVCNLILNIVPWGEMGYEVVGIVNNGIEAYKMICENKPDVVITDARMPGYDGIELIKHTRESNLNPIFIIISGYKYFEYAYNALQYGVEHYLLKPINKSELCQVLDKIRINKMKENEKIYHEINIQNEIMMNKERMRRHFISNFIYDGTNFKTLSMVSLERVNSEYNMNFKEGIYQAVFVKIDMMIQEQNSNRTVLELVLNEVDNYINQHCQEYVSTITQSGVMFLVNYLKQDKEMFDSGMEKLHEKVKLVIDKFNCFKFTIGLGLCKTDFDDIADCISSAVEAVKYRIIYVDREVINYNEFNYRRLNTKQIFTLERKKQLESFMETDQKENYKKLIDTIVREIHCQKNYNPIIFYEIYEEIVQAFQQVINDASIDLTHFKDLKFKYDNYVDNAFEERKLIDILYNFVASAASYICKEKEFEDKKPIRLAKQYIEEHFHQEISLELVSRQIHLSSAYLSTIFRKETGMNFSEYLINCRIESAKRLLKKTDKSMVEISESIGYSDVKYFSKLFNKVVGLKPSEYRKLYS